MMILPDHTAAETAINEFAYGDDSHASYAGCIGQLDRCRDAVAAGIAAADAYAYAEGDMGGGYAIHMRGVAAAADLMAQAAADLATAADDVCRSAGMLASIASPDVPAADDSVHDKYYGTAAAIAYAASPRYGGVSHPPPPPPPLI